MSPDRLGRTSTAPQCQALPRCGAQPRGRVCPGQRVVTPRELNGGVESLVSSVGCQGRGGVGAGARLGVLMGQIKVLTAGVVSVIAEVLAAEAWGVGGGLRSPEHWVAWRTGVSPGRAAGLVAMARRQGELTECGALFRAGSLGEDAMRVIATKAPVERDGELAGLAPMMMHTQLSRILRHLPDQEPGARPEPGREVSFGFRSDGWWEGRQVLPPDEGAVAQKALEAARGELFGERQPDADPMVRGPVSWGDAFVRVCEVALDGLDPATRRGEARGERAQVIVHVDARSDGDGQARLHLGPQLPDALCRYLCCDAKVRAAIESPDGSLLGISPLEATVNPRLRVLIEQRDQGCRYPGCSQQRWVQVHHLIHREHGGLTIPKNLLCLCPFHHRLHHHGAFSIEGNPESAAGLRFIDHWGHDIGPPRYGPVAPPAFGTQPVFTPPTGEPLDTRWFTWN
ncbi:MAG: DUF222 domain-containing protein [Microthrixaceae bacterium]